MTVRSFGGSAAALVGLLVGALVLQYVANGQESKAKQKSPAKAAANSPDGKAAFEPKTDAQWRKILTEQQYKVTRKKGTERAFSGEYWNCKDAGVYRCVCCGEPLFSSETKFESGTGWPSFWRPIDPENIASEVDRSMGGQRIEVHCKQCNAHLGHVFEKSQEDW